MIRKSGYRFSGKIMLKHERSIYRQEAANFAHNLYRMRHRQYMSALQRGKGGMRQSLAQQIGVVGRRNGIVITLHQQDARHMRPSRPMLEHDGFQEESRILPTWRRKTIGLPVNMLQPLARQIVDAWAAEIDPAVAEIIRLCDPFRARDLGHARRCDAGTPKAVPRTRRHVDRNHDGACGARGGIQTDKAPQRMTDINRRIVCARGYDLRDPIPDKVEDALVGKKAGALDHTRGAAIGREPVAPNSRV
jgi:hypothetical protein